ncbi:3-methyladenine DNA glycosylase [Microbacterium hominis]|uniref:3-methyladenine DNA glycosylase n=1 Tax=Microbacterium hominis TaxID=162426 RepID=A0A7D4Q101_9MICO|nr:3-methyladenine DNA glycosylase [Microbacterium hominis]QKJ19378.1 3-methyladenine DNA glycosylase [Microbacterium hominis]
MTPDPAPRLPALLGAREWQECEQAHIERADALTAARRARASHGRTHPVDDFLFTYYSYKPAVLRRWHPGPGVALADAAATPRATWRWYSPGVADGSLVVDAAAFASEKRALLANIGGIVRATARRAPGFDCFGLHEWAMVYRAPAHRHDIPLRLGQRGTDDVVEAHDLRCTHFDAYRFFTADAAPRNRSPLTRQTQSSREQPGCLHAGMDLYKWAVKLGPLVPGDLLLDAFVHARAIRDLDMEASPYDLREWGVLPVAIETPEGKAEYVRRQRALAARGQILRTRLLEIIDATGSAGARAALAREQD